MAALTESPSFTAEWLHQNHELYTAATNHSFIASIRDGSVDVINFKRWMVSLESVSVSALCFC